MLAPSIRESSCACTLYFHPRWWCHQCGQTRKQKRIPAIGNCLPVIEVCLWLDLVLVAAAVAVVVVEALDDDEVETQGCGADNDTGVAVTGVGGEPDIRESGGGS